MTMGICSFMGQAGTAGVGRGGPQARSVSRSQIRRNAGVNSHREGQTTRPASGTMGRVYKQQRRVPLTGSK